MSASNPTYPNRSRTESVPSVGAAPIVFVGRLLFALIFIMSGPRHFLSQTIAYAASQGVPMASIAVPFSGCACICWRPFHSSWLPGQAWGLVDCAVSCRSDSDDPQVLGGDRPHDVSNAVRHVHEERFYARRCTSDHAVWLRAVESGCAREVIAGSVTVHHYMQITREKNNVGSDR